MSKNLRTIIGQEKTSCDTFNHQQNYLKNEIEIKYYYKVVVCFQVVELMHPNVVLFHTVLLGKVEKKKD